MAAGFDINLGAFSELRVYENVLETSLRYARIVSRLRADSALGGRSKADFWIAAWGVEHDSPLATRDRRHFGDIPGLALLGY